MFKKAGYVFAVCAIGILAIGWSPDEKPAAAYPARADDLPESPSGRPVVFDVIVQVPTSYSLGDFC